MSGLKLDTFNFDFEDEEFGEEQQEAKKAAAAQQKELDNLYFGINPHDPEDPDDTDDDDSEGHGTGP